MIFCLAARRARTQSGARSGAPISSSISRTSSMAPPCSGPWRVATAAVAGAYMSARVAAATPPAKGGGLRGGGARVAAGGGARGAPAGEGGGVQGVVGVQHQDDVEVAGDLRVGLLAGEGVGEVGGHAQGVARLGGAARGR